jgi:hypothetical protein
MIDDVTNTRLVVASLVTALLASPVILDACLFRCHTSTQADEGVAPSCHHAAEEIEAQLAPPPGFCGHDHGPAPSIASPVQLSSSDASLPAVVKDAQSAVGDIARSLASSHCTTPPGSHRKPAVSLRL